MFNNENTKNKGVAVDATTPKNKTTKPKFTDNSLHNQRLKLLHWFFEKGAITTAQAREQLDIMHPAGRVRELKARGNNIVTVWDSWTSEHGIKHRIARYILVQKQPIQSIN